MNVINYSQAILLRNQSLREVSITREGDEAILKEVVSPGLIAVNTKAGFMFSASRQHWQLEKKI